VELSEPRARLGFLTPSSNTALEPLASAMLAPAGVGAHFARFRVVEIGLGEDALAQFDPAPMLSAAELLADARVDAIVWSGTSGGWLGLDADRELCRAIEARTGIAATTSTLALVAALGGGRLGLVTPYVDDVQERILATLAGAGIEVVAERHLGRSENHAFATVPAEELRRLVRETAAAAPDAVTTFCTNLRAAQLVPALEDELGLPVYDTVSLGVWAGLGLAGLDPAAVRGWGRLFGEDRRGHAS
jgi:maleate isomerase